MSAARTAPGPSFQSALGFHWQHRSDPLRFYVDAWRRFGDVVRVDRGATCSHLFVRPDHVKQILQDGGRNYRKAPFDARVRPLVGDGLGTSSGAHWRRQRRLMQPIFRPARIAMFAGGMIEAVTALRARWRRHAAQGQAIDVYDAMSQLNFDIMGRTLMGTATDSACPLGWAMRTASAYIDRRLTRLIPPPQWLPTPAHRRFARARDILVERVAAITAAPARPGECPAADLASILSEQRDDAGVAMGDDHVRDEILTLVLAWHDTTPTALSWAWYLLSHHADAERQLHAELDGVLCGRIPTPDDLPRLPYTRMVIEEAMRLYPPIWALSRHAIADDDVGGYQVPAGTQVIVSPYITHRHPAFWEDPESFDPLRFTPERRARRPPLAYLPFGGGPRQCIGSDLAIMEMQMIVAAVAQTFRLLRAPACAVTPTLAPTLRPLPALWMTPQARR
jgi:cytochrome P450